MILCDTNVLVALVDSRESLSANARRDLNRLKNNDLFVTEPVLTETFYLLHQSVHRIRLRRLIQFINIRLAPTLNEQMLLDETFGWLEKYADHAPDWTDAHLISLCSSHQNWRLWSYDREFKSIWRLHDGSPVPLVNK